MRKDHFLKRLNLVLQLHEIRDCLVPNDVGLKNKIVSGGYLPFIGVIDALQGDVFLVLKEAVKLRPETVKSKLRQQKLHICADERTVPFADQRPRTKIRMGNKRYL